MAAAKKPAKKTVKSGAKGAGRPIGKVAKAAVKKIAAAPKAKTAAVRRGAPAPVKGAKALKAVKAAPVAKQPVAAKARPRGGRPARASKEPRQVFSMPAPGLAPSAPLTTAAKAVPAPSAKDVAAAHEYLLARSATRSEESVTINGRRLPTEGELLKTSESSYMNEEQLAFFKHRLQQIESELLENADQTTEHLRETVIVPDPADRATIEEEHALELRTRDRERKLLKKVQQALARIDSGDYGYCEETGDPIGIPRLLARPTATLSLEAQQRRELKQKMFGD